MTVLSAHIGYLFTEHPLPKRPALAKAAGFEAVEHPNPFDLPARELRTLLADAGLGLSQISSGLGAPGEKGLAALPGREVAFREGFARALDYAEEAGAALIHAMAGVPAPSERGAFADATYRGNLEVALRLCEGRRPRLMIEAISQQAVPGYHMATLSQMFALARDLPGVLCLLDTYHAALTQEDAPALIREYGDLLAHVHIADHPGRHEPGSGNLAFEPVLTALAERGYSGAIGFEYLPSGPAHLDWLPTFAAARDRAFGRTRGPNIMPSIPHNSTPRTS